MRKRQEQTRRDFMRSPHFKLALALFARLGFEGQPPRVSYSNHFEAGASRSVRDRLVVRVNAYWRSDRNSFENTELANVRVFLPTTFARGKAYGVQFPSQLSGPMRNRF